MNFFTCSFMNFNIHIDMCNHNCNKDQAKLIPSPIKKKKRIKLDGWLSC